MTCELYLNKAVWKKATTWIDFFPPASMWLVFIWQTGGFYFSILGSPHS